MAPGAADKKAERSYISSAVDSINPWGGSRSSTPTPRDPQHPDSAGLSNPGDHSLSSLYGQSLKRYPPDCPPLVVKWFHAVDIPKRKPKFLKSKNDDPKKTPAQPKKFLAFTAEDSRSIEAAYQTRLEELEGGRGRGPGLRNSSVPRASSRRPSVMTGEERPNTGLEEERNGKPTSTRVPVNEDFLFDVDVEQRELAPVYWLGPVYEVRRGSWFYQEGSTLRPCEENLAAQLEEGYLKVKPWQYPAREPSNPGAHKPTPKSSRENLRSPAGVEGDGISKSTPTSASFQPQTYRLFGTWMNSVATYQDAATVWLTSDSMLSWVTSTVYERFAGGGYMSGIKLVRGYTEAKKKEEKRPATPPGTRSTTAEQDEKPEKAKRQSMPPNACGEPVEDAEPSALETKRNQLTRHISTLIEARGSSVGEEEAIRQREEKEMEDDYNANTGETQGRDIEHLILVTHGIGQLLGMRMESINFVHDVNVMRKTFKSVYSESADLRALNNEIGESGPGNCRVQILPVLWRHLLDFPKRRQRKAEYDIGDDISEDDEYPALEDITIEGVAFARSLVSDLALDVLLYQSAYREQITEIVLMESNRIYNLFKERNPEFNGKVHIIGHSLGSAIMFDILCRQKEKITGYESPRNPLRFWPSSDRYEAMDPKDLAFEFDVDDLYCLGSPVGLFQMLKGRTISARHLPNALPSSSPLDLEDMQDPFLAAPAPASRHLSQRVSPVTNLPFSISSPKVSQLFNIFHPSDPIAYRLEPLVSTAMSALKPQALPYTKKGIFGSVAPQGLTGIGAKVGQSVSGLWSSLSAGISNSLLNRSLGLTQEDVANITASHHRSSNSSPGAGTNISAGGVIDPEISNMSDAQRIEKTAERQKQLAAGKRRNQGGGDGADLAGWDSNENANDATLIDDELETLYAKFQKKRVDLAKEKGGEAAPEAANWLEEEHKSQKLKKEEAKVRALNRNGRVDYSIQEGVLDYNPLNTIASHMSYWADEDVSHFVLSQLLSSRARTPKAR